MMLFLLCVGLTLVGAHKKVVCNIDKDNFNMPQISGKWHSVFLSSDDKEKIVQGGSMRIFVEDMDVLQNGSLYLKYHFKENDICSEFSMTCDSTDKSGCFEVEYDGHNAFCIVETNYCDYLIFHLHNEKEGEHYQTMELYSRKPNAPKRLKKKFEKECLKRGIPKENILDLTEGDRCAKDRSD
ncbi:epididymal-specific lipocalin-9 [Sorex fumeus]|uniref:epididymal-specific lipocalin-9 n=1 Tax=Sorex fumeus TaxID=62283 RepID=UPI0024ACA346|nr:epididymal-specific lipocalin-9 [Sorex fumeus]